MPSLRLVPFHSEILFGLVSRGCVEVVFVVVVVVAWIIPA